jgi:hypothetical protein
MESKYQSSKTCASHMESKYQSSKTCASHMEISLTFQNNCIHSISTTPSHVNINPAPYTGKCGKNKTFKVCGKNKTLIKVCSILSYSCTLPVSIEDSDRFALIRAHFASLTTSCGLLKESNHLFDQFFTFCNYFYIVIVCI